MLVEIHGPNSHRDSMNHLNRPLSSFEVLIAPLPGGTASSRITCSTLILAVLIFDLFLGDMFLAEFAQAQGFRGLVTSKPCPYSCATEGIPRIDCRDWNHGDVCFIEDFRYPQGNPNDSNGNGGTAIGGVFIGSNTQPPSNPQQNSGRWGNQGYPDSWSNSGSDRYPSPRSPSPWGNGGANYPNPPGGSNTVGSSVVFDGGGFGGGVGVGECQSLRAGEVAPPRVYISRVTPAGGGFSQRVRVQGTIEGVCLSDAGIFEGGRKLETISVRAQRRMQRYDFDVQGNSNGGAEIRVYNSAGEGDAAPVRPVALPNNGGFGGFTGGFSLGG